MRQRDQQFGSNRRAAAAALIVAGMAAVVLAKLVELQVVRHEYYAERGRRQHLREFRLPALRGELLARDSYPLAISIRTESAVVNPQQIRDPEFFARVVAPVLGLKPEELSGPLMTKKQAGGPGASFHIVARHLTPEQRERLRPLQKTFPIHFVPDARRDYPNGVTGAHVVGAIGAEGDGNAGVEQKLNDELKGRDGLIQVLAGSRQDRFITWTKRDSLPGVNVTLSIDRVIQHDAERFLREGIEQAGAESGTVVVMDPRNGEILALANYPTFDPRREKPTPAEAAARHSNIAVQIPCEPGSVMKMITVTMGIDTGLFRPESLIYCENGAFPRPGRRAIHDVHRYGTLDLSQVLIKSSNIGVVKVSLAAGPQRLYEYLKKFGIGDRTGIELPAESRGILRPQACRGPQDRNCWSPASHEYIAFGHEVSATAVQLARAVAVIANGGLLVQPHLVIGKSRPTPEGREIPIKVEQEPPRRVLRPETAITIRRIMERVVLEGTGKAAAIPGYSSGGKTGSAEIFENGRWLNRHNASFIGFAPVANPRVVVVVTLNRTPKLGGASAAPVFRKVAETALRVLHVPMDRPETAPEPKPQAPPKAPPLLASAEKPEPREEAPPPATPALVGPKVPDFRGRPLVAVLREAASLGLPVETLGRGVAREQSPPPGTVLAPGMRVQVRFGL
ncbi:MAG: penicillin-binding protein [Bryobacteraceae bacterium]|nr:MAG: penicillin-binding protein [Bryobacteraceae bacterium]